MRAEEGEIPSYVAELYEAERQAPRPSAEVERRVRGRVAVTLAATALGAASLVAPSAAAATAAGATAKAGGLMLGLKLSVVVSVGAVGVAGGLAWRQHAIEKSDVRPAAEHRGGTPAKASPAPALPEPVGATAPTVTPLPPAPTSPATSPSAEPGGHKVRGGSLALESPMLNQARASIEARNPAQALLVLGRHARQFPRGQLEEEREALWVQALVAKGDAASARARASEFRRRFPRSIQLHMVESAVSSIK